ncbi:MAG: large subunit ribosomal protein [Eubacteriales bacterium]|nr:large subunit ribosomal protein [Eubacteriales bacterium]
MKVILKQDVKKLGKKGDVVEVAEGYARNYLLPRGLAVEASAGNLKTLQKQKEAEQRRREEEKAEALRIAEKLKEITVVVHGKAGENGRLFGSVTAKDVAEALARDFGIKIDRRKMQLEEPIKAVGVYYIPVRLHAEVEATVKVHVNG